METHSCTILPDAAEDFYPPAKKLDERLMTAAEALIYFGECIEVIYCGPGQRRRVRLASRGPKPETVELCIWSLTTNRVYGNRPVRYDEVELPAETLARLEKVALEQEERETRRRPARQPEPEISAEMARTLQFIQQAKGRRRNPSGQFAGHSCEPAGRR